MQGIRPLGNMETNEANLGGFPEDRRRKYAYAYASAATNSTRDARRVTTLTVGKQLRTPAKLTVRTGLTLKTPRLGLHTPASNADKTSYSIVDRLNRTPRRRSRCLRRLPLYLPAPPPSSLAGPVPADSQS